MITLPAAPEAYSAVGILLLLLLAWSKMKPALKEIETKEAMAFRSLLIERIKHLEDCIIQERKDCEAKLKAMQERFDQVQHDMQERLELLMDALLASKSPAERRNARRRDKISAETAKKDKNDG